MTHKAHIDATAYPDVRVEIPSRILPMSDIGIDPDDYLEGNEMPNFEGGLTYWIMEIPELDKMESERIVL